MSPLPRKLPFTIAFLALAGGGMSACGDPAGFVAATLTVTSSTTGTDPDLDGYSVSLDDALGRPLARNATLTLVDLEPGEHRVSLGGSAPNCVVAGENPKRVSLEAGVTVSVTFYVSCTAAATGAVAVHTVTTGEGQDPDGYMVAVDGSSGRRVASNASLTLAALAPGDHRIDISDVITNCSLAGEASRTVSVREGETEDLTLAVGCTARSLHIVTTTTGRSPDPDGYTVAVDGGPSRPIAAAGSLNVGGLVDGEHTVQLGDLAAYCDPGQNPRTVRVASPVSAVSFEIACDGAPTDLGRILLAGLAGSEMHLFVMRPDGSDVVDLTPTANGYAGRWSPDRSRIVFETSRNGDSEVFVMDADGSHPMRLAAGRSPGWSPDGTRIAFISGSHLGVMNADGSGRRQLPTGSLPDSPSWSPDGSVIAYTERNPGRCRLIRFDVVCARDIYVVSVDGTGGHQVTRAGTSASPEWSPDGITIAFSQSTFDNPAGDLYLISPDGSQLHQLTSTGQITEAFPVWSPDGRALAFGLVSGGTSGGDYDIALIPRQGGPSVSLLARPGQQIPTSWR